MGSPHILELSGIGSGARLQSLGINVVRNVPGVGENFRDHFAVRLITRMHGIETINERVRGLPLIREVIRYGFGRRGALSLTPTLVYCFWKSDPVAGKRRYPDHLCTGKLSWRRSVWLGPVSGCDCSLLATAARKRRPCSCRVV